MYEDNSYLTISKISNKLDIQPHVLRFWEKKFSSLNPKKGTSGRRYYSNLDVDILILIKDLLYTKGYTIKGANHYMNSKYNKSNVDEKKTLYPTLLSDLTNSIDLIKEGIKILSKNLK